MLHLTFDTGIPSFGRLIVTPFGLATVQRFYENGSVDIYIGGGRTFNVPGSTSWRSV
jgi:hypothetical protein